MRCSIGLFSSPRQYAPATACSLNVPEPAGGRHVRAAAQVDELVPRVAVDADHLAAGLVDLRRVGRVDPLDELPLVRLVGEQLARFGSSVSSSRTNGWSACDDLAHLASMRSRSSS